MNEQNLEVDKENEKKDRDKQHALCECLNINKKLAPHIKKVLNADGITKDYIYPDFDINTWDIWETCVNNAGI